jgi:hypothetical protein
MAGRYSTQGLSSFSWRREAEMSAARQRLSRRTEAPRSKGRRSVWRVLAYSTVLAAHHASAGNPATSIGVGFWNPHLDRGRPIDCHLTISPDIL